jgi:aminoacylase
MDNPYIFKAGIPVIVFSPMPMTPVLLHDHDEFINEDIFLKGIETYMDVIENLINV